MPRLAWLSDLHLNFLAHHERELFYATVRAESPDIVLVGGDTGEASSVELFLIEIESYLDRPIYFVLGNHDFYWSSIASVRRRIAALAASSRHLRWLNESGLVPLNAETALIGHDSWADARCGDYFASDVMLNDYHLIDELSRAGKTQRYSVLNALGDEAAAYLRRVAAEACARFSRVIVLTHVPPFREACWHEGRISDDAWLPHFASRAPGEALVEVAERNPGSRITVLCGHTHSAGYALIRQNLEVHTAAAEYGLPAIQRVLIC